MKFTAPELEAIRSRLGTARQRQIDLRRIRTGKNWILAVAILSLLGAFLYYVTDRGDLERRILRTEEDLAPMSPEEREEALEAWRIENGHSWEDEIAGAKAEALFYLLVDATAAGLFFAAYLWARRNPLAAALFALVIFAASTVVQVAMAGPVVLCQGFAGRIFVTVALVVAILSAARYGNYRGDFGAGDGRAASL